MSCKKTSVFERVIFKRENGDEQIEDSERQAFKSREHEYPQDEEESYLDETPTPAWVIVVAIIAVGLMLTGVFLLAAIR